MLAVVALAVAWSPPARIGAPASSPRAVAPNPPHISRRTHLVQAAAAAATAAALLSATPAFADAEYGSQVLDLSDELSAPAPEPMTMKAVSISAVPAGQEQPKKPTAYGRIKELEKKGNLSDKERKELKRLKGEEARSSATTAPPPARTPRL